MADVTRMREAKGFYSQLNSASSGDLLWGGIKKRRSVKSLGIFAVERVISRRKEGSKTQYLIKWEGYSSYENTWEDEENLTEDLIRNYESPHVEVSRLQKNRDNLRAAFASKLKSRNLVPITIDFDHDCFRVLFNGKGRKSRDGKYILMEKRDFDYCNWEND